MPSTAPSTNTLIQRGKWRRRVTSTEEEILKSSRVIAIVGLSSKPDRPSYGVASYLMKQGYRIIPVNPKEKEILGEPSYPDLGSIPEPVDVVDIFRRSEEVPGIVDEAIRIGAKAVWMQEDVIDEGAATKAREAGIEVVMDMCMKKEHQRMRGEKPLPPRVCEVVLSDQVES